ncbi:gluconokinase, GntK/IdnK-type [Flaviaesturariibacter amylovorans]|uniref:Gluconokinase n=1 Tax=Flaviaesturariibacter amylovorans TaxID=1084520 RepID=A0ABP8H067_9BACT
MVVIVMGVSGSGKSTVGRLLAARLRLPFIDADDVHSSENIAQMQAGLPLTDDQRAPWLRALAERLRAGEAQGGVVLACSALKERYRGQLRAGLQREPEWIFLDGTEAVLRERLAKRSDHFMPEALLDSQLAALERPSYAQYFDVTEAPVAIVSAVAERLKGREAL